MRTALKYLPGVEWGTPNDDSFKVPAQVDWNKHNNNSFEVPATNRVRCNDDSFEVPATG